MSTTAIIIIVVLVLIVLAILFATVLGAQRSFGIEQADGTRDALRLSGLDPAGVFLGKAGAAVFRRGSVGIGDLAELPLVLPSRPNASRRLLDGWVAQKGVSLTIKLEVDDHTVIRGLVRQGVGVTLLTQGAFDADLRHGEVEAVPFRPRAYWPLALVAPAHGPRPEVVTAFIRMLRTVTRELVSSGAWPGKSLDPR